MQINAYNDVHVIEPEVEAVCVITHRALLPYLPGILRLTGIGYLEDQTVRLDPEWSGWSAVDRGKRTELPRSASIHVQAAY
ncbi:hypothetical protein VX037_17090 [Gordonia sp. Z-3]|uniref:hypothetical protein n=1 Tax=Gordonia sp. Z-3 TaxID=3115408 RepID=UPI002E2BC129|nr:hypothetical protein [Gordonia sp. Z-3]MED5802749.1 hypothetical protein [Gordonia sp. Z-3]